MVQSSAAAHHPRHHYRLAASLQDAGYDVHILAQPGDSASAIDAVPVCYLPLRRGRLSRVLSGPLTIARALRRRPAVLYVVCLDLLPWAVLARMLGRCKVVYDASDDYDTLVLIKDWLPPAARRPIGELVKRLEPWLVAHLDAATTALPATQARFRRAGSRAVLVRNFPPAGLLATARPEHRADVDVVVAGSLEHDQIALLAQTAAALERLDPSRRWLAAVRGANATGQAAIEDALTEHGVRERFDLRFDVPFSQMPALLASARLGLILYGAGPAYASRVPLRIYEYMAAGLPFVAPDMPGLAAALAGEDVAMLTASSEPAAYAALLHELLAHDAHRLRMAARGPEVVRERYNWEREALELTGLFETLIGMARAAAVR